MKLENVWYQKGVKSRLSKTNFSFVPILRIFRHAVKAYVRFSIMEGIMAGNQDTTDAKSGYESFIKNLKRSTIAVAIVTIIVVAIIASRA